MSDELRAWLEEVRDERNQAQVALQNGDDGPMRLWALRHGHVLIDKCEELAGAFGDVPDLLRNIADAYLKDTADFLDAHLRAPGGGEATAYNLSGYCECVVPEYNGTSMTYCTRCLRECAPGGAAHE